MRGFKTAKKMSRPQQTHITNRPKLLFYHHAVIEKLKLKETLNKVMLK
jgi:hypothetical protein